MAVLKSLAVLVVLSTFLAISLGQTSQEGPQVSQGGPAVSQGGPHQNEGRSRRQAAEIPEVNGNGPNPLNPLNWTTCDVTVIPKISCHDCQTRVICKPVGGLLKACNNPASPHCNRGVCSAVPSADCV